MLFVPEASDAGSLLILPSHLRGRPRDSHQNLDGAEAPEQGPAACLPEFKVQLHPSPCVTLGR